MRDKIKKILSFTLGASCVLTAFVGCKDTAYKGDELGAGYDATATVESNGGFAVQKGDYIYFINGQETYSANNEYGNVVKGALMRIHKDDLANGNTQNVKTVVPSLFVSQNYDAGIYIYGNYVYYATPTSDKNMDGEIEYTYIDFKRAPLDGSQAPDEGHFARLSDNATTYRFVQDNGVVYCLYEVTEDGVLTLKSHNVNTGVTTTLVEGANDFFYDTENPENATVYYTMAVNYRADSENPLSTEAYNQIYSVNASATATVDAGNASYTVYNGDKAVRTYAFDKAFLESKNEEAKDNKADEPYDFGDYTTYPYVNLGTLVLDGIGKNTDLEEIGDKRFNWNENKADRMEQDGYTYTVKAYQDGGLYFTRSAIMKTGSPGTDTKLYYLADNKIGADWNTVKANDGANFETVALNTTNTTSALFLRAENEGAVQHYYMYANGASMYKEYVANGKTETVKIATLEGDSQSLTPWKVVGEDLYFFSGSGNSLSRVNWTGDEDAYNAWLENEPTHAKYQAITFPCVNTSGSSWYKPEIFGDNLLYSNAQTFGEGTNAYNYIYTMKLGAYEEVTARVEKYEAVKEYMEDYSAQTDLYNAMEYYFNTLERTLYDEVKDEFSKNEQKEFEKFVEKFQENGEFAGVSQVKDISLVGKMTDADKEAINKDWKNSLPIPASDDAEEEKGLPTWAIWLIVCGSVVIVAAAVIIPLVIVSKKKKAKAKEAAETVNAYKRKKIDTTDDLTIDVYANEDEEKVAEETTETPVEESVEQPQSQEAESTQTEENKEE